MNICRPEQDDESVLESVSGLGHSHSEEKPETARLDSRYNSFGVVFFEQSGRRLVLFEQSGREHPIDEIPLRNEVNKA
jgi:hypothetical protein